jgi:hypothetical protein
MSERDDLQAFYNMKDRLEKETRAMGLYLEGFAVIPNKEGPDFIQAMFLLGDRAFEEGEEELSEEEQKVKDEFDALISMDEDLTQPKSALDLKKDDAVESMKSWFDEDD